MKTTRASTVNAIRGFIVLAIVAAAAGCSGSKQQQRPDVTTPRNEAWFDEAWQRVDSLEAKQLIASARDLVDEIHASARAAKLEQQLVKALIHRSKYRYTLEEDEINAIVADLDDGIATTSLPAASILQSIRGDVLWRHLQYNRYRFYGRTTIAGPGGDDADVTSWSLSRLVSESLHSYLASVAAHDTLAAIPVEAFDLLILESPDGRRFRPTLFDLLAHRALDFLENSEAGLTQPVEPFVIDADAFLRPASEFAALTLATPDTLSFRRAALRIHQQLLLAHESDMAPEAFVHANLRRLRYVREQALGQDGTPYVEALRSFAAGYSGQAVEADILLDMADELARQGNGYDPSVSQEFKWHKVRALEVCEDITSRFAGSDAAKNCQALADGIHARELDLESEGAVVPDAPSLLRVAFRNVPTLYLRVYRIGEGAAREWSLSGRRDETWSDELVRDATPVVTEEYALPVDGDYQRHATEVILPALGPGAYVVVASDRSDFDRMRGVRFAGLVLSSRLSYFQRNNSDGTVTINVVDRSTGVPASDVSITPYRVTQGRTPVLDPQSATTTDGDGRADLKLNERLAYVLEFRKGDDWLVSASTVSSYAWERMQRLHPATRFFTDRAIYRPGQTIHFKAILLQREGDAFVIRPNTPSVVRFTDANGREVARMELRSNEFGTVSGQFRAPSGGLTGAMALSDDYGSHNVYVEEYKRPRFDVTLEPYDGTPALGDEILVRGRAVSFAGAPIGRGQVVYRARRVVYYPWRPYSFGRIMPRYGEAEIASGVVETAEDGTFVIPFVAKPDPTVRRDDLPVYRFVITADVTDPAGETQSAESTVLVGERSLVLGLEAGEVIDRAQTKRLTVTAASLDGTPVRADGRVSIQRLNVPGALLRPTWQPVDTTTISPDEWSGAFPHLAYPGSDDPARWPVIAERLSATWQTTTTNDGAAGPATVELAGVERWPLGYYRVTITANDNAGRPVEMVRHVRIADSAGEAVPGPVLHWQHLATKSAEPGQTARLLTGSSERGAYVLVETEVKGEVVETRWIPVSNAQTRIDFRIEEAHRGGVSFRTSLVRHNRFFSSAETVDVPWSNKELTLRWGTFRDKLEPGASERWTLEIGGPRGERVAAEVMAAMYDASLDQFAPHDWSLSLWPTYGPQHGWNSFDYDRRAGYRQYGSLTRSMSQRVWRTYDELNLFGLDGYGFYPAAARFRRGVGDMVGAEVQFERPLAQQESVQLADGLRADDKAADANIDGPPPPTPEEPAPPPLRSNFDETAFFLPTLAPGPDGTVTLTFDVPESLTRWRFLGLAHTRELQTGRIEATAVTQRELMITANVPRFLREGDAITITATVDNRSDAAIAGTAGLTLLDAQTMQPLAGMIRRVDDRRKSFQIESGRSARVAWVIDVPAGVSTVLYRLDAASDTFSDGEESVLPVLTNRMLVTESLPLPMSGPGTRTFRFDKLAGTTSPTLRHERLFVEYTANPVWYAVQALPYMMEYPYECSEQVFSRFYANGLATLVVDRNPRIKEVFDQWAEQPAGSLLSNLERNADLKSLLIEETPWVREAANESERKRRIATLFDLARMRGELMGAADKLEQMQAADGAWPWFAGGPADRYITQHIIRGVGMLDRVGVLELIDDARPRAMAIRALAYLDAQLARDYERLVESGADMKRRQIGHIQLHALYARSFFGAQSVGDAHAKAYEYYVQQASEYALDFDAYGKGMVALVLSRSGSDGRAAEVIAALRETAIVDDELGMYWKTPAGWLWYQAPIETQALLVEAFSEVADDDASVSAMQLWLLKQKQTRDWKTTRATADAVYALVQRGASLIDQPGSVNVELGGQVISTDAAGTEAATGYVTASWGGAAIGPDLAQVTVTKTGPGPSWGAVYWQYFEDLDRVTSAETPLSVRKKLFVRSNTAGGPELTEVTDDSRLTPGDELVVRVEIRTDRDMDYVHLKDMRAAGTEPTSVLSGYRWAGGLGYYESTRDAATNFFFSYLPRGTHVLEYSLRARHAGDFSAGVATIQSMYAPEFAANSGGGRVRVDG